MIPQIFFVVYKYYAQNTMPKSKVKQLILAKTTKSK